MAFRLPAFSGKEPFRMEQLFAQDEQGSINDKQANSYVHEMFSRLGYERPCPIRTFHLSLMPRTEKKFPKMTLEYHLVRINNRERDVVDK